MNTPDLDLTWNWFISQNGRNFRYCFYLVFDLPSAPGSNLPPSRTFHPLYSRFLYLQFPFFPLCFLSYFCPYNPAKRVSGSAASSPAGSRAEPRPQTFLRTLGSQNESHDSILFVCNANDCVLFICQVQKSPNLNTPTFSRKHSASVCQWNEYAPGLS